MSRKQKERKQKNEKDRWLWQRRFGIGMLIAVFFFSGNCFARYRNRTVTDISQVTADNFYFTTNLHGDTRMLPAEDKTENGYTFGEKATEKTVSLYGGGRHRIDILVQNYYDEFRITEQDITYEMSGLVQKKDGTERKDTAVSVLKDDREFTGGRLAGQKKNADQITILIPSHMDWEYEDGTIVIIRIKSTSPYRKTMTLKFVLYGAETTLEYAVKDCENSPYAELIMIPSKNHMVQPYLEWTRDLDIDNTNKLTFQYIDGTFIQQAGMEERFMQISEPLVAGSSASIYFFKRDPSKDYSVTKKTVDLSEDKAIIQIKESYGED